MVRKPAGDRPGAGPLFSRKVVAGRHACLQLSVGANGEVVRAGDFQAHFRQVVQNLAEVLKGLGADYKSVVKFTTYLTRSEDIEKFIVLRRELVPKLFGSEDYPPNTLLIVSRLVKADFLVELEAVAAVDR